MLHCNASNCEAVLRQAYRHGGMSPPAVRLPLYAAPHEVSVHARHGHTNTYALEGTAMVAGVAIPAGGTHRRHTEIADSACQARLACSGEVMVCQLAYSNDVCQRAEAGPASP
jgi:hypothetical protein